MRERYKPDGDYIYNQIRLNGFKCRPKKNALFIKPSISSKWAGFNYDGTVAIPPGVNLNELREMIETYDIYMEQHSWNDGKLSIDDRVKKLKPPRPQWKGKKVA